MLKDCLKNEQSASRATLKYFKTISQPRALLGSLSNDDGDGNDNAAKQ